MPKEKTIGHHETWRDHKSSVFTFLFLMLFVVCKLWILVCIFHSLDGVQH